MKIAPYLKSITLSNTGIQNIDAIYMINLERRRDKLAASLEQWEAYDLCPNRFNAIDGWALSDSAIDELCLDYEPWMPIGPDALFSLSRKTFFHHSLTKGGLGCALSHLSIYKGALEAGYETIWVLEDDATVEQDPRTLATALDKLDDLVGKEKWDILYTDDDHYFESQEGFSFVRPDLPKQNMRMIRQDIGSDFSRISARCQTHSMILRRSALEKIISFLMPRGLFRPIDVEISFVPTMCLYNLRTGPVHGRNRPSFSDTM